MKLVTDPSEHEQDPPEHNVIPLGNVTHLDIDPDQVLRSAIGKLDSVIVIGYTKDDGNARSASDEYFASSIAAGDTCVWLLHRYILKLLQYADKPDDTA